MKKSVSLIWRSWQQYCYKHQHRHFYLFLTNAHCPFNTSHWLWDDASLFSSLPQFLSLLFETLTFWQVLAALETVSQVSFAWCFCCCLFFCLFSSLWEKTTKERPLSYTQSREDIQKNICDIGLDHLVRGVFAYVLAMLLLSHSLFLGIKPASPFR